MLSRELKTIFVHIPKTAGQSVEFVFLEAHGLTWDTRAPLLLRHNPEPEKGPERLAHLYAWEYVACGYVTEAEFEEFTTFAIVRDPYARIVSSFNYRNHKFTTIRDFCRSIQQSDYRDLARHVAPQMKFLAARDREDILVDEVLRFERVNDEIGAVFQRIFGKPVTLPHRNAAPRQALNVAELAREDIDFINETYADDFKFLGYEMR